MNLTTLQAFRHAIYECFERAGDALFNTIDALLTEDQARSFPELSLSPSFPRRWPSLYEAFEDGRIDEARAALADLKQLDSSLASVESLLRRIFSSPAAVDHILDGLRKAGLPE